MALELLQQRRSRSSSVSSKASSLGSTKIRLRWPTLVQPILDDYPTKSSDFEKSAYMTEWFGRRRFPPSYYADASAAQGSHRSYTFPSLDQKTWGVPKTRPDQNYLNRRERDRVDVLHPPTIVRRTVALETGNQNAHNHNRVANMQHKMYTDYINARKPAFYGKRDVREEYKRNLRESLKAQIRETADKKRQEFDHNRLASRRTINDFRSQRIVVVHQAC